MEYTEHLEIELEEMNYQEIEEEDILKYLEDPHSFMNFGDGLRRMIRRKMPGESEKDEAAFLEEKAKAQGISLNRNTVKNWFEGKGPKKGDKDRERMFAVCFAMGFNLEETIELFTKVYSDKTFNLRNYREFIYFCAINNGWDQRHANDLIERAALSGEKDDKTLYTRLIHDIAKDILTDEDVLNYISKNGHNFDLRNESAKKILEGLLYDVQGRKGELKLLEAGRIDDTCSYIARECAIDNAMWESFKIKDSEINSKTKKSIYSVSTMVDIIYGLDMARVREDLNEEGMRLIKNARLPDAIKGRLPLSQTFSKKEPTAEEYRKMIILLFSYKFWCEKDFFDADIGFEDYRDELNGILYRAYLHELYIGNPSDWFFMYCTMCEESLAVFRNIIGDGLLAEC